MILARLAKYFILGTILLSLLTSCDALSQDTAPPPATLPSQNAMTSSAPFGIPPTPQPGMASFTGMLHSYTVNQDLPETLYYLTRGVGEGNNHVPPILVGPLDEKGDIRGFTDSSGRINVFNIPPGNYFIIVWAPPYNWEPVVISPEEPNPLLMELEADENLTLDTLYVSWP